MSATLNIPANERGVVRVFALSCPPEQARFLQEPGALAQAMALTELDLEHVDIIQITDLEELGLAGYLREGLGIAESDLAPVLADLNHLEGWALILRSAAFGEQDANVPLPDWMTPVATLNEPGTNWQGSAIPTESAKPHSGKVPPRVARAEARRIGATWFTVVMSLIIGGVLWLIL